MDSEKLRIRPDDFVSRHKNDIMGRQREFYEALKTNGYKVSMHIKKIRIGMAIIIFLG